MRPIEVIGMSGREDEVEIDDWMLLAEAENQDERAEAGAERGRVRPYDGLTVDFAPVADADNQDLDQVVFDAGNDSVVAYAIFPKIAELRAL
jgi:hypothetical protein